MSEFTLEHFRPLADKAGLPEFPVLSTVKGIVHQALEVWRKKKMESVLPDAMSAAN